MRGRIAAETGALVTSAGGRGARIRESDSDRLTIDAVATQLVLRTQPSDGQSGNPLLSQPTIEALDDSGFVDYLEVLDTERTLFNAEISESDALQQYIISIVQLYKALGGGWEVI